MKASVIGVALTGTLVVLLGCSGNSSTTGTCHTPTVISTAPSTACQNGSVITLTGTNLTSGMQVSLQAAGQATISSTATVASANGTSLTVTMPGGLVPGVIYNVVAGSGSCTDAAPHKTATAVNGALAYLTDPDVTYNGINTRVTVYATTLALPLPADAVQLTPTGQTSPATTLAWNPVANHPNRVQVVLPAGQAPGTYDLRLTDAVGCQTVLSQALQVTSTLSVSLKAVAPPFGDASAYTSISVTRDTSAAAPADHPFVATPGLFLNPTNPAATDVAIPVQSVSFVDGNTLTAVIPPNQPPHTYDLIVVNPDGTVGLLPGAFRVQSAPPPVIATVTPSSIISATNQAVSIAGTGFDATSAVSLTCQSGITPSVTTGAVACSNGQCTLAATINASTQPVGDVCVLRVTNADGSFFDYSAVGVTNPSLNLTPPHVGTNMTVARRALVAASGNATPSARFLYAVGGDDGTSANSFSSVEVAPVDLFGNIGTWASVSRSALNASRSQAAGLTLGRYIYVLGGTDGTNALQSAERAMILDPVEVPILDVDDITPSAAGLAAGTYVYRVAAVFSANDPDNPAGESLPSDELVVRVPAFQGHQLTVVLSITAPRDRLGALLPNVTGYRIYRSPTTPGVSGDEVLLGTVASGADPVHFSDDGTATPGTDKPLPLGSLGKWRVLPAMAAGRTGPAAAAAPDPATAGQWYVYGIFGMANATVLGSYEYLPVTIAANGHQTVAGSWTPGAKTTATPRWRLGAWKVDRTTSSTVAAGDTWVYVGGGSGNGGGTGLTGKVEAGKVATGGDLGTFDDTPKDFSASLAGYGVCAANGQLFTFGGANSAPSTGATSATLIAPPPTLAVNSWNSEGLTMTQSRYLMGSAVQSAFIFLLGGSTATQNASATTELVIW
jgi:large repetitive protein